MYHYQRAIYPHRYQQTLLHQKRNITSRFPMETTVIIVVKKKTSLRKFYKSAMSSVTCLESGGDPQVYELVTTG